MSKITLNHLVYQILEFASSGGLSTDLNISYELAAQWVHEQRSVLISRALNNKDQINDSWIQYIPCIELEQVKDIDCPCNETDCYVLRSKLKIPSSIDTYRDNWIVSVTTVSGNPIGKLNPIRKRYVKYNKYTSNSRGWYIKDDYIYILNDQVLNKINISGLFEFPEDVSRFNNCEGVPCFTGDSDYPASLNIATQIVDIIIKTKLQPFIQFPNDNLNDGNSNTPKQTIENKEANK